jgi:hypothetical protein
VSLDTSNTPNSDMPQPSTHKTRIYTAVRSCNLESAGITINEGKELALGSNETLTGDVR